MVVKREMSARGARVTIPASLPPRRRGRFLLRLAAPLTLLGTVAVVLLGGGFYAPNVHEYIPQTYEDGGMPGSVGIADDVLASGAGADTDATAGTRPLDGYTARPGLAVTTPSQRIERVYAKRDQTLTEIAQARGVSVAALLWANTIPDPDRALPVGFVISVPPKGTMLHRVRESDTLEGIARAFRVSAERIANYPANYAIQTGELIPATLIVVPTTNLPMRDRMTFYQVREGDSLGRIAALYGLRDPRTLQWANRLTSVEAVRPAQVIAVPPADGVIHVVEGEDARRSAEDAVTQIAKNYACAAVPCTEAPREDRVTSLRDAVFAFGPNALTRGGRLVPGRELLIPGGIPYVVPPPVVIPPEPRIDNPLPIVVPAAPQSVGAVVSIKPTVSSSARPPAPAPAAPRLPTVVPAPVPIRAPAPIPVPRGAVGSPGLLWPESGAITTQFSGAHNGIDIAAPHGTPLRAAAGGRVTSAGWTTYGLGIAVYIDHGGGLVTVYGHMASTNVSPGQYVAPGQMIGAQGNTGNSTGPHVHFTVLQNGRYVNPLEYLR